jgi:hypothetical protein
VQKRGEATPGVAAKGHATNGTKQQMLEQTQDKEAYVE